MTKLVISDDESKTTVVPLVRDEVTIGRKEGNTIRLTERNVSRRHARLERSNGAFHIEDLGSYNGVRVNGSRIQAKTPLKDGDHVQIGDYTLLVQQESAHRAEPAHAEPSIDVTPLPSANTAILHVDRPPMAPEATVPVPTAAAAPAKPARLVLLGSPEPGAEYVLDKDEVLIGRAEECDVSIDHRSISREHAKVLRQGETFRLIDLGSANGVRVNGESRAAVDLQRGSLVELGTVKMRFVSPGEAYRFDADATVQVDRLHIGSRRIPWPVVAGGAALALVVGLLFLLLRPSTNATRVQTVGPPGTGAPRAPMPAAAHAPSGDGVAALLGQGQAALARRQWIAAAQACGQAAAAAPQEAGGCLEVARREEAAQAAHGRLREALGRGDLPGAIENAMSIPATSVYRQEREIAEAGQRWAEGETAAARAELQAGRCADAQRRAETVTSVDIVPEPLREAAAEIVRQSAVRCRGAQAALAPRSGQARAPAPRSTDRPAARPAGAGNRQQVLACDNQLCVIRVLEGRLSSAQEGSVLYQAYINTGNAAGARRTAAEVCRRWRNTPTGAQLCQVQLR